MNNVISFVVLSVYKTGQKKSKQDKSIKNKID